jgi:hypothetical protein
MIRKRCPINALKLAVVFFRRAGHGSVRAGFGPFGHPTRAHRVWKFPTRN